jgi:Acetyltransferase (GNAT) family
VIEVVHFEQVNGTEALPVLVEGWSALMHNGLADPVQALNWDDEALLARREGEIAGAMSFMHIKHEKTLWVRVGYVRPTHRRRRVYSELWNRLVAIAMERHVREIQGGTSVANTEMQAVNDRLGRVPRFITYSYKVTDQQ